jgi:hypothetical protein
MKNQLLSLRDTACNWEVRSHYCMCKEMPVIPVSSVVDPKRIMGKMEGQVGGKAQGVANPSPQKRIVSIFWRDVASCKYPFVQTLSTIGWEQQFSKTFSSVRQRGTQVAAAAAGDPSRRRYGVEVRELIKKRWATCWAAATALPFCNSRSLAPRS